MRQGISEQQSVICKAVRFKACSFSFKKKKEESDRIQSYTSWRVVSFAALGKNEIKKKCSRELCPPRSVFRNELRMLLSSMHQLYQPPNPFIILFLLCAAPFAGALKEHGGIHSRVCSRTVRPE